MPRGADDEEALTADIIELARQYGRYGYRRLTALLRNAGWRYSLFLLCLIVPVAILANVLRIVTLILLTYHFGDAVGQGFLHVTAGLFLFAVALVLMFAIDNVASRLLRVRSGAPA